MNLSHVLESMDWRWPRDSAWGTGVAPAGATCCSVITRRCVYRYGAEPTVAQTECNASG